MPTDKNHLSREFLRRVSDEMPDGASGPEAEQPQNTSDGTKKPSDNLDTFTWTVIRALRSKRGSNQ